MNPNELLEARAVIGSALKAKRQGIKMNRNEFSKMSGLSRATIVNLENGSRACNINTLVIYEHTLKAHTV